MKISCLVLFGSIMLALSGFGQAPSPESTLPPLSTPASVATAPALAGTTATASSSDDDEDENSIENRVARKLKRKFGVDINVDNGTTHITRRHGDKSDDHIRVDDDFGSFIAIPIIGIIFSTLFGAPVLVVAAIMFFSYLKSRSLHRTVRTMVEKGQEVPAALFAPPPVVRARSDMRRGVVLLMVGTGLMMFFGAVNDWEGGAWTLGLIPFLIGVGYLLVWKLEGNKDKTPPVH